MYVYNERHTVIANFVSIMHVSIVYQKKGGMSMAFESHLNGFV